MRAAALALRFLLELAALAGLVVVFVSTVEGPGGWLLGLAAAAFAALAWGLVVSPRATIRAPIGVRFAVELAVFGAATAGLLLSGHPILAGVLAGLYIVDRLVLWTSGAPFYEEGGTGVPGARRG